ncbi:kynurenine/alpha-aminoadipate aminotransferase, mitochondrial-like [Daktulosphaira vitifoliae]|uniref:kynurenine/alpha-aminoadipate aminotransferase, mitochondrial-like n=1 Tax=Daktulosphaira vitifoliae TaxID=58002 RepID=UPI0021A9D3D1|nr:kynurenine/alpha-aminoadipate aminotransferase, mitochondrial-like [Daktulosphaira vitifoliae]XP_050527409.1 kynurenine/alpha-aminoadipate aminotransferase, mitochondrial-like [Daktulosphaira vitifoliae]
MGSLIRQQTLVRSFIANECKNKYLCSLYISKCFISRSSYKKLSSKIATNISKPKINVTHFFNDVATKRTPSELREIASLVDKLPSNCIKLAVGVPNVQTFPFKGISVELISGERIELSELEFSSALQYLPSMGYAPLLHKLKKIQDKYHGKQNWNEKSIMVTSGAQEGLSKAVDMCMKIGDPIILPEPIYPGAKSLFTVYDPDIIAIREDATGMIIEDIENALRERKLKNLPIPKILYLNPTASNPSGVTIAEDKKKYIYSLACEFNLLILEDDPYYHLSFEKQNPVSFMSMDVENRVLRFDSFSKIMSSGLRVGFVTGPKTLLRQMELHVQSSTIHTSSLSQVLVNKLLMHWDDDGWVVHINHVKQFYLKKKNYMIKAIKNHLDGLVEWVEPSGGMFLWLKVIGLEDTKHLVTSKCLDKLVVVAPGYAFSTDSKKPSPYLRLSYSIASPEEVDKGIKLLAESIREELISR